ncbi:hypothetical protein SEVIR_5G239150v4 [Setaria viridis]
MVGAGRRGAAEQASSRKRTASTCRVRPREITVTPHHDPDRPASTTVIQTGDDCQYARHGHVFCGPGCSTGLATPPDMPLKCLGLWVASRRSIQGPVNGARAPAHPGSKNSTIINLHAGCSGDGCPPWVVQNVLCFSV